MAKVVSLTKGVLDNPKESKETDAIYYIINRLGAKYLQIDTFGSKSRKFPDKVSQIIRFNKEMALKHWEIIEEVFK
jgi:hypothetical protein